MADFPGVFPTEESTLFADATSVSANLGSIALNQANEQGWVGSDTDLFGGRVRNSPVTMPTNPRAFAAIQSYSNIFYNRIHVVPEFVDVGSLVIDQERQIIVWNGHFDQRTMTSIDAFDTEGLTLSGAFPQPTLNFAALQERFYDLSISLVGPTTINARYLFNFDDPTVDRALTVTGSRVVMLPFAFQNGFTESFDWLTDIMTNRRGVEQRVRLRRAPRQRYGVNGTLRYDEASRLNSMFSGWRANNWAIPMWAQARNVITATQGAQTVTVDTTNAQFVAGELALVWQDPKNFDVFEVADITPTSLGLTRGLNANYTAQALCMPVKNGRLLSDPTRNSSGNRGSFDAEFDITSSTTFTPNASYGTFNNRPLLLVEPINSASDSYNTRVIVQGFPTGIRRFKTPWLDTKTTRNAQLRFEDLAEQFAFRAWLYEVAGRAETFYFPTYENDLIPATAGPYTNPLEIQNDDNALRLDAGIVIGFETESVGWTFRTITNVEGTQAGTLQITFDSPLTILGPDLIRTSITRLCRLANDSIEIRSLDNCVSEISLPVVSLE